ncbi:acyltransferase family protein [Sphaerotilus natans]|uniref:acyltransferase family protein n=1 Tax=Sphaerotilus natans TaxID=34103 RepID=UPI00406C31EF
MDLCNRAVFIHAYETNVGFSSGITGVSQNAPLVDTIRNLISQGIARTAVPLFFMISGYLFFKNQSFKLNDYKNKLRKRSKTLLIPFLFWNFLTLFLMAIAQCIPATQQFFSGKNPIIVNLHYYDYLDAIFGITRSPISYQFWFIRDLIVMVLLTPLIFVLCKKIAAIYLPSIFFLWMLSFWPFAFPSAEALLFFSTGALLSIKRNSIFLFDRYGNLLVILYVIVLALDVIYINSDFGRMVHKIGICFGVSALLYLTKYVALTKVLRFKLIELGGSSFFVFAAHEPLLTVFRKVFYRLIEPTSTWTILVLYFAIPTFVIIVLVPLHGFLMKVAPTFARIINGGR